MLSPLRERCAFSRDPPSANQPNLIKKLYCITICKAGYEDRHCLRDHSSPWSGRGLFRSPVRSKLSSDSRVLQICWHLSCYLFPTDSGRRIINDLLHFIKQTNATVGLTIRVSFFLQTWLANPAFTSASRRLDMTGASDISMVWPRVMPPLFNAAS